MTLDVAIIGSGFGGLGATVELRRRGVTNVAMLERAGEIGGTWRDNTYPGCRCDVASNLYSFSFAPNPSWSNTFSFQPEIQRYLLDVTDRLDLRRHVRFHHDVTDVRFDEGTHTWRLATSEGNVDARCVILATGGLAEPRLPDIKGLHSFVGPVMHTAKWDASVDLTGKRVAVIGTGASAIQTIPQIAPGVGHLDVFQRTPSWVLPHLGKPVRPFVRRLYRFLPVLQRVSRLWNYWRRELLVLGFVKNPDRMSQAEEMSREHLASQVADPALREKLTPHYRLGCKRVLIANDYYPVFNQSHVDLVTESIEGVEPAGIRTSDGVLHEADVVICATGFYVTDNPMAERVHGRRGESLAQAFRGSMATYRGTAFPDFPNLFMLGGPNTALGHSSIVFMHESQLQYIVEAVATALERDVLLEPTPEAAARWTQILDAKLPGTVWGTGCESWYLNAEGRNTTIWPDFTFKFRRATRDFVPGDHVLTPA